MCQVREDLRSQPGAKALKVAGRIPSMIQIAAQQVGGAIGLAVSNTWLQNWTKENYLHFRESVNATNIIASDSIALIERNLIELNYAEPALGGIKSIYQLAQREAYIITFNQVFAHVAIIFFAGILLIPLIRKIDLNKNISTGSH